MPSKNSIEYYLQYVESESINNLSFEKLQKIFLLSIKFFIQKEISLDDLSNIASTIWPIPLDSDTKEEFELKEAIHSCSEINFYIRKIPELDNDGKATLSYLMDTFKYYNIHKSIVY